MLKSRVGGILLDYICMLSSNLASEAKTTEPDKLFELCIKISVPPDCLRFPQQEHDILLSQKPLRLKCLCGLLQGRVTNDKWLKEEMRMRDNGGVTRNYRN